MSRVPIPKDLSNKILNEVHHRCCICVEHRKVANIHHIDQNNSNNTYDNLVAVCAECHADLHTKSTMRRNITQDQIRAYREDWKKQCKDIEEDLKFDLDSINQFYYINVHRLEPIFKSIMGYSMIANAPYRFRESYEFYNTLWHNMKNSLGWMELIQLREYFSDCANLVMEKCSSINLSLLEFNAYNPGELKGQLVHFSCQFLGKDIPDKNELILSNGLIEGPPGTLRREIENINDWEIIETCMLLDNKYYFSDSAFIHFSENGNWNGLGILGSFREGIGSNDGQLSRKQIIISPLCIGVPVKVLKSGEILAQGYDMKHYSLYIGENKRSL